MDAYVEGLPIPSASNFLMRDASLYLEGGEENVCFGDISNNDSKEPLYKIYFIDDYKYVKAKKINKI